ncbi:MAG: ribulose-phosphate 3-epimerase [Luteitalea sp.]|nr:ribulose-phosphate 3-epimerase [Luteitalea sp.]
MSVRIASSILAADFAALGEAVRATEEGGADWIHVDVMDGHFVPNITIGPPVVAALKRVARVPLDVHLMITEPDRYLEAFAEAGANHLIVHVEATPHLHRTVHRIQELGLRAGVALNPSTPIAAIEEMAADLDIVLLMSVNPGFGGQAFIPRSTSKVRAVRGLLERTGSRALVSIDGGIDTSNAALVVDAGVDVLIAGTTIFGTDDAGEATRALRRSATRGLAASDRDSLLTGDAHG